MTGSILDYPIVIKKYQGYLVISVPDLGVTHIEDLPPKNRLTKPYVFKLATALAKVWLKSAAILKKKSMIQKEPPVCSSIRGVLGNVKKEVTYSPIQAVLRNISWLSLDTS